MAKQFRVSSNYCGNNTPEGLEIAIDRCLNHIAGQWLTTDFEIDATIVTDNPDGTTMVAVIATRNVLPAEPYEQKEEDSEPEAPKEVGRLSCDYCSWTGNLDDLACPSCGTGGGVHLANQPE